MHDAGLTRGYFACDVGLMGFRPSLLVSDSFDFWLVGNRRGLLFLKSFEPALWVEDRAATATPSLLNKAVSAANSFCAGGGAAAKRWGNPAGVPRSCTALLIFLDWVIHKRIGF